MRSETKKLPITELLKDIVDNRGKSVPTASEGTPLIATNCIKHSSIYPTFDKVRYVNDETLKTWFRAHLQPNDILFVNKGTPGRVCLVPDPVNFCAAQDMIAFRCDEKAINYKYLFAILRSNEIQKKIENYHVGLVIPHFRKQDLSSLMIPIRSPEEQEAIGDLYLTLSQKIELNNRINAELEAMAKTLYDYWFVQFDFPNPKGKPYKTGGGKMVWNAELKREIPEGWDCFKLSKIISRISTGLNPRKNFVLGNGSNYYVTIKNIDSGKIFLDDKCDKINDEALKKINRRSDLKVGDILFTSIEPVGITYLIQEKPENWNINESVFTLRPNYNLVTSEYAYLLLSAKEIKAFTKNVSAGSIHKGVRIGVLNTFKVAYGNKNIISDFSKTIEPILKRINILNKENQKLSELRDWLLPMLMNGQVKVN